MAWTSRPSKKLWCMTWAAAPSTFRSSKWATALPRYFHRRRHPRLGGDDFDQRVIDWLADEFNKENGIDLRQIKWLPRRLKEAAEKAKIELSRRDQHPGQPALHHCRRLRPQASGLHPYPGKFNELTADWWTKTMEPVKRALKDADCKPSDMHKVLLVGGSTVSPPYRML